MGDNEKIKKLNDNLEEAQLDALCDALGKYFMEEDARELDRYCEEAKRTGCTISDVTDKKIRNIPKQYRKEQRRNNPSLRFKYILRICSIVAVLSMITCMVAFATVEPFRATVYKMFMTEGDGNVEVQFKSAPADSDAVITVPEDVDYVLYTDKIPDNYRISEYNKYGDAEYMLFVDKNTDDPITIDIWNIDGTGMSIDTEHSVNTEMTVNNSQGFMNENETQYSLSWQYEDKIVDLTCTKKYFSLDEVMEMAENVQKYRVYEFNKLIGR